MIEKIAIFCKNFIDWFKSDRCFLSNFIKAFPFANNFLLITIALFLALFNALYFGFSMQAGVNIFIVTFVLALLSSAIVSGFCHIVKKTLKQNDKDKNFYKFDYKKTFELFYSGVGKRYLSFFFGFILFFIILIISIMISLLLATKFICPLSSIGLDSDSLQLILSNQEALYAFASQMNKEQVTKLIELFYITNIITPGIVSFLLILWIPELMYTGKNIFVSLYNSIKKLFSDFWNVLSIYAVIVIGHLLIGVVFAFLPQTSIFLYIGSLIFIYWLTFNVFTIFIYYREKYVRGWIA